MQQKRAVLSVKRIPASLYFIVLFIKKHVSVLYFQYHRLLEHGYKQKLNLENSHELAIIKITSREKKYL